MVTTWLALTLVAWQTPDALARQLTQDTSRPVTRARSAQERFERGRRDDLPVSDAGHGRCDERIGRFCYWYEDGDTSLPEDPVPVRNMRARLLSTLASAQTDRPESDWVVGQRVRYLIEQDQPDSAIGVALRCGATGWWCDALGGLAHHVAGHYRAADSLFDLALAEMPEPVRCAWTDWTVAYHDPIARRSKDADCAARAALADTAFWLGQPLLSRPGNDLRTEFLSRRVMASLHAVARSPHLIQWGRDMEELMLRYGWSTRFSRTSVRPAALDLPSVIGHQRSPAYHFLPLEAGKGADRRWEWDLSPDRPRARYAPVYADAFREAKYFQLARFPRGDSTLVVGGIDVSGDSVFDGRAADVGLAAGSGPRATAVAIRDSTRRTAGLVVALEGLPRVASVEARPHGGRKFLRGRIPLTPISRDLALVLSDPLLFAPGDGLPASLEEAAAAALASTRFSRKAPVGVYWEVTGPGAGADSLAVSVSVIPVRRGLLGRLGEGLSVVKRKAPLTLQWQAGSDGEAVMGRSIELDLSRLKTGRYLLRLELRSDGAEATTERSIELTP